MARTCAIEASVRTHDDGQRVADRKVGFEMMKVEERAIERRQYAQPMIFFDVTRKALIFWILKVGSLYGFLFANAAHIRAIFVVGQHFDLRHAKIHSLMLVEAQIKAENCR